MRQQGISLRRPCSMDFWSALDDADAEEASASLAGDHISHEEDLRLHIRQKYDSFTAVSSPAASSCVTNSPNQPLNPPSDQAVPGVGAQAPMNPTAPAEPTEPMPVVGETDHAGSALANGSKTSFIPSAAEDGAEQPIPNAAGAIAPIGEPLLDRLRRKKQSTVVLDRFGAFQAARTKQLEKQAKDREKLGSGPQRQVAARGRPRVLAHGLLERVSLCIPPANPHQRKHEDWWAIVSIEYCYYSELSAR